MPTKFVSNFIEKKTWKNILFPTLVAVFDTYGNSPLLLNYFIVTIMVICFCLLGKVFFSKQNEPNFRIPTLWKLPLEFIKKAPTQVSTQTLFLYHVSEYESKNFSKSEAIFSAGLAKMFNWMSLRIWLIEVGYTKFFLKFLKCHKFEKKNLPEVGLKPGPGGQK